MTHSRSWLFLKFGYTSVPGRCTWKCSWTFSKDKFTLNTHLQDHLNILVFKVPNSSIEWMTAVFNAGTQMNEILSWIIIYTFATGFQSRQQYGHCTVTFCTVVSNKPIPIGPFKFFLFNGLAGPLLHCLKIYIFFSHIFNGLAGPL